MLESVLLYLNNWFMVSSTSGTYTIEDGSMELPFLVSGQYFRIMGSLLNDGVHQYPATDLKDETFEGEIWALAVPPGLLSLVEEITAWQAKNADSGPYTSESFGGYSYSKATNSRGVAVGWQDTFAAQLAPYRKLPGAYPFAEPNPHMTPPLPRPHDPWR